jgi:hypothetical protein
LHLPNRHQNYYNCHSYQFSERIRIIMQLFMDLFAVQCTPSGRLHWDITIEKSVYSLFEKSIITFTKVLELKSLLRLLQRRRLEWRIDAVLIPQTEFRSSVTFVKHVEDSVRHMTTKGDRIASSPV